MHQIYHSEYDLYEIIITIVNNKNKNKSLHSIQFMPNENFVQEYRSSILKTEEFNLFSILEMGISYGNIARSASGHNIWCLFGCRHNFAAALDVISSNLPRF